jgi:hypothetical protein
MMKLAFLLLCGLILSSLAVAGLMEINAAPQTINHGGKIESKYDGFNHETVIALQKMRVTCGSNKSKEKRACVSLAASLHAPGKQLDYVRAAKLQIIFETKDWDSRHPLDQRDLLVVANGETLKLGRMGLVKQDVATDKLIDVMNEVLEVSLPYTTFEKIARADYVEVKVGHSEFALQEKNIAALRDLNNRVKF